jgi:hypothetical protein
VTEAQRFLRYVIPGLTFGVEALMLLLILLPDWTVSQLRAINNDAALAAVLAAVLGSGGIGFLFSVVHHEWHWRQHATGIDHSEALRRLAEANPAKLQLVDAVTQQPLQGFVNLDRRSAWILLTALWHERLADGSLLKTADPRASGLTDLAHSTGTGRVASIMAYVTALVVAGYVAEVTLAPAAVLRFILANGVAIAIVILQHRNYARVCAMAQGFIEQVFCDALAASSVPFRASVTRPKAEAEPWSFQHWMASWRRRKAAEPV